MTTAAQIRAAHKALATHDALRDIAWLEPSENDDPEAWIVWHNRYKPAYAKWSRAMDDLGFAFNEPHMSRHPFNFRPRCEEIIA